MKKWLGKSLKHKLSLLIIVATMVPLLFLGLFSYRMAGGITEEKAKISGMNSLRQLEAYLVTMIKDAENMSIFLIGHSGVQSYLKSPERETNYTQQTSIISFLTNLAFFKEYIANIVIEPLNAKQPISHRTLLRSEFTDITERIPDYYAAHPKWWSDVHRQWTSEGMRQVITLARPIRSTDKYKLIGKVQINIDQAVIANQVRQAALEQNGFVMLLDEQERVIAGPPQVEPNTAFSSLYPGMELMEDRSGTLNYGEGSDKKTVLYKAVDGVNWKLVGMIPAAEYRSQNQYVLTLTAVAVSVAALLIMILVVFLIQKITKPLSALASFLKSTSPDEPLPAIPVTTIDEVGQLVISYNRLSSRIVKLTEEVKLNESLKKEADMQALQVQINPHFLYNTLSSVQWLALMNKDGKIAEMVGSLSDFLRFSLNNGQEYCTIRQEMEHVQSYARIQSIRYPDKLSLEMEAAESVQEQRMLKLLLQPLVENALQHGILKRQGAGTIRILIQKDEQGIRFTVTDDGIGMPAERMSWLKTRLHEPPSQERGPVSGGFGLRNVNHRLQLHYGKEYGLKIESMEGKGTRVSFVIPDCQDRK